MDNFPNDHSDVVAIEDGSYVFWPTNNVGFYRAHHLRRLADWLDQKNKEVGYLMLDKSEV